jgi:hypothetical protein
LAVAGSTVYWANAGSETWEGPASNGSIVSAPLAGGTPIVLADGQSGPMGIAVDDANVYWTTSGTHAPGGTAGSTASAGVWALPLGGGTPRSLASGAAGQIAAAGGVVVFVAGNQIMKVSPTGGDAVAIATTDRQVTSIALDGSAVYWTDADSERTDRSYDDGRVRRATLDGASSSVLASAQAQPGGLSLAAGTLTTIASGLVKVGPCAADGAHVAWVVPDGRGNWKLIVQPR